jgi:hypothetical protein
MKTKTKTAAKTSTRMKRKTKAEVAAELYSFKVRLAVSLGIAIPAFSIGLSHVAGTLAMSIPALAGFIGIVAVAVLYVSLSHIKEAVQDCMKASDKQAWAMAIALDCTIVAMEMVHVYGDELGVWWWATGLMLAGGIFSATLNCYAFLKHVK